MDFTANETQTGVTTTEMKALHEYALMVVFVLLLKRARLLANET